MKKLFNLLLVIFLFNITVYSQYIPQHISYTQIYDFLDEMANNGVIELNSAIKPYSRSYIAQKLVEIQQKEKELNKRQQDELYFYLDDYALELNQLPDYELPLISTDKMRLDLLPPVFNYNDTAFRAQIHPLLGMNVYKNSKGTITQR